MIRTRKKLKILLIAAAVSGSAFSQRLAALTVKNTSTYVGAGRWDWTIFIEAGLDTLQKIECVEYVLHPTFTEPVRRVCSQSETKFAHSTNGWGTFTVKVNILFKNGSKKELKHHLIFEQQSAPTSLNVTPRNWSREIEPGWWEWCIFIDGPQTELDRIRCVEYTLHPTFPNPVRVICSKENGFELCTRGWGTFTVKIKLMLKNGSIYQMNHLLEFR